MTKDEALLLAAYSAWSEETYAATFREPTKATVKQFSLWLWHRTNCGLEDFEKRFLAEYEGLEE